MKLKNKQIIIALTALALISGVVLLKNNFLIIHNKSESLPSHWFVISKGQVPQKDQIFAFKAKDNPAYKAGEIFIKIVGGVAGDKVEKQGGIITEDGKPIFRTLSDNCKNKKNNDICKLTVVRFDGSNPDKEEDLFYQLLRSDNTDAVADRKRRKIEITDKSILVSGKMIGVIKPYSKKGKPLSAVKDGIIPSGKFFAYTTHKDSYDSRYQEIGLIDETQIIGTAVLAF